MTPDDEFRAAMRHEQRQARAAARSFAAACKSGSVDDFADAVEGMEFAVDGWRLAMLQVARLTAVNEEIQRAFLNLWIQHKHLPLAIGHRPTTARILRLLLPRSSGSATATLLYRGTGALERTRRLYGFSWTSDPATARKFAERQHPGEGGAVILATDAPPDAVLHIRQKEDWYDEDEVVVDPYRLGRVKVLEKLPGTGVHLRRSSPS